MKTIQEALERIGDSANKAHKMICELALDSSKFSMSIPAQDYDSDMVLQKPLDDIDKLRTALEKAVIGLEYNISKHNQWVDKGHWCDSKKTLQSVVDSSKSTISEIKKLLGVQG